jgi:hypothetical protein
MTDRGHRRHCAVWARRVVGLDEGDGDEKDASGGESRSRAAVTAARHHVKTPTAFAK